MSSISIKPGAFYSVTGWTDPRVIYASAQAKKYGSSYKNKRKWASPLMPNKKVDAHKYKTEAGSLPIEVCRSMWLIKYGNEPINAVDTVDQDDLMWEIGNRLFWAGLLEHDTQTDRYTCRS